MSKLASYFLSKNPNPTNNKENASSLKSNLNKRNQLVIPCPGFDNDKNPEKLQLYNKYRRNDTLDESFFITCKNGV